MNLNISKIIDRREMLCSAIISAGVICLGSCTATTPQNGEGLIDAGALSDYARDGEFDRFAKSHGFMLTTFGGKLIALSAVCTYRNCIVEIAKGGDGYECPCHGCRYDRIGQVRQGPVRDPLVHFVMSVNSAERVFVDTKKGLIQPEWGRPDSYLRAKV